MNYVRSQRGHGIAAQGAHMMKRTQGLLEIALQHDGDLARDRVGAAAGRPRHDQRDRPFRKGGKGISGADDWVI